MLKAARRIEEAGEAADGEGRMTASSNRAHEQEEEERVKGERQKLMLQPQQQQKQQQQCFPHPEGKRVPEKEQGVKGSRRGGERKEEGARAVQVQHPPAELLLLNLRNLLKR